MERVAVFVDAGYFFSEGSNLVFKAKLKRSELWVDADGLIRKLKAFARELTKLGLLRIYWYDGTSTGPTPQHRYLASLFDVKVRLGYVNPRGEQKEVDSLIVTDMVALARNNAMASCILFSGDGDLRIGVQLAQEHGVRVHLLGIAPARNNQANLLRAETDTTHQWQAREVESVLFRLPADPTELPRTLRGGCGSCSIQAASGR